MTTLKDGEKGAVLQRDKESYAIVPHLPVGLITPAQLRQVADVAEKYQAVALKITSAARIAIVGLKEEDLDRAWTDLGMNPGAATGLCVRSIKACPGNSLCRLGQQNSLAMGQELDRLYHGMALPSKLKMGVSGCPNQCAESGIKDIGLFGRAKGWSIVAGGNAASRPRIGEIICEGLSDEQALAVCARIVNLLKEQGRKAERLGRFIDRFGWEEFKAAVLVD